MMRRKMFLVTLAVLSIVGLLGGCGLGPAPTADNVRGHVIVDQALDEGQANRVQLVRGLVEARYKALVRHVDERHANLLAKHADEEGKVPIEVVAKLERDREEHLAQLRAKSDAKIVELISDPSYGLAKRMNTALAGWVQWSQGVSVSAEAAFAPVKDLFPELEIPDA